MNWIPEKLSHSSRYRQTVVSSQGICCIAFNEIELSKGLNHPNISAYLGSGYIDECFSIILEYVVGGSVRSYTQKNGPLSNEFATRCLFYMLLKDCPLYTARKLCNMHRDVKAANVLITSAQEIKIADFGISKQLINLLSGASSVVGTPYWMAPAVIRGKIKYTDKVDIWGVGVTTFEFLSGWVAAGTV